MHTHLYTLIKKNFRLCTWILFISKYSGRHFLKRYRLIIYYLRLTTKAIKVNEFYQSYGYELNDQLHSCMAITDLGSLTNPRLPPKQNSYWSRNFTRGAIACKEKGRVRGNLDATREFTINLTENSLWR